MVHLPHLPHLPHLVLIQLMTAALRPDRNVLFAVLDVSTSRYFDVSCIPIVALLLCLIVLTSVTPLTMFHAQQCIPPLLQGFCIGTKAC